MHVTMLPHCRQDNNVTALLAGSRLLTEPTYILYICNEPDQTAFQLVSSLTSREDGWRAKVKTPYPSKRIDMPCVPIQVVSVSTRSGIRGVLEVSRACMMASSELSGPSGSSRW